MNATRFTKLNEIGEAIPDDAAVWVAVLDNTTGLVWSANHVAEDEINWKDAKQACAASLLCDASDWRLPTVEELSALADRTRLDPAIDTAFFPNAKTSWYWSSTPDASSPSDYAWIVNFYNGYSYCYPQDDAAFVRAVRSAPAPALSAALDSISEAVEREQDSNAVPDLLAALIVPPLQGDAK